MIRLGREDARRCAVRAQLLTRERPTDLMDVVRHLGFLQVDLTTVVAPNAELVCWTRLGPAYRRGDLDALAGDGALVELQGLMRPADDVALFRADMARWPGVPPLRAWQRDNLDWVTANDGCRRDILAHLRCEGPTPARAIEDTCVVPWRSTGWTNDRNVMKLLELMEARGEVAVAGREGRERLWDLAERVHPGDEPVDHEEAHHELARRRLRALGIARPRAVEAWHEPYDVRGVGEEAVVEGIRGRWRVDPEALDTAFTGRVALLSPLDRLVFDRKRMGELFDFDYQLEMYKPAARRRWGYWAMPVLSGDRLVGKLDATADSGAGVLAVDALHEDGSWSAEMRRDVAAEVAALASWLGLEVVQTSSPALHTARSSSSASRSGSATDSVAPG